MISLKRSFQSQQQTSLSKQIGGCIRPTGLLCVLCFLFKKSVLVAEWGLLIYGPLFFSKADTIKRSRRMIKMNYKKPCIISLGKFSDLSIIMAVRFPIKVLLWSQKGFF